MPLTSLCESIKPPATSSHSDIVQVFFGQLQVSSHSSHSQTHGIDHVFKPAGVLVHQISPFRAATALDRSEWAGWRAFGLSPSPAWHWYWSAPSFLICLANFHRKILALSLELFHVDVILLHEFLGSKLAPNCSHFRLRISEGLVCHGLPQTDPLAVKCPLPLPARRPNQVLPFWRPCRETGQRQGSSIPILSKFLSLQIHGFEWSWPYSK